MNKLLFWCLLFLGGASTMNAQQAATRTLFPIENNTGFIDRQGRVVIPPKSPELLAEVNQASKNLNSPLSRPRFKDGISVHFGDFSEGFALAGWSLCPQCRNPFNINGIIDETGRLVIPPKSSYSRYGDFHEGLARFHGTGGGGFIDRQGNEVIPAQFYEVTDFSEGLAAVRKFRSDKYGYINRQGKVVVPFLLTVANPFHDGLALVTLEKGNLGFIDQTGRLALSNPKWLDIADFSEGLAAVQVMVRNNRLYQGSQEELYGFIDRTGKFVIPPRFANVRRFAQGRAVFVQYGTNHGYGYLDTTGTIVIPPTFADARDFSEGLAAVAVRGPDEKLLWGYINPEGKPVIAPQFRHVQPFKGGLAGVNCDEYCENCKTYIDAAGTVVWQSKTRQSKD
ncbi:MAG: WG repeat-containing protein [Blastocatellia bacterium]|nr:WG repeat-containing protein [Blastocatellia bacterium]